MCSLRLLLACWFTIVASSVLSFGCASAEPEPVDPADPDAAVSTVPRDPTGTFAIASDLDLRAPRAAAPMFEVLVRATDGPDDPARFLVDRLVAELPAGTVRTVAELTAPYIAAYVTERLTDVAPRFVTGVRALASGLQRAATRIDFAEELAIGAGGSGVRTVHAVRFATSPPSPMLGLAAHGGTELVAAIRVALDADGELTIQQHALRVPYGALVRLALDHAVIPSLDPTARDLPTVLIALVDCDALAAVIIERLGFGPPALYATACRVGLTVAATEAYAQIAGMDAVPHELVLDGAARGVDADANGTMDEVRAGTWRGVLSDGTVREAIEAGRFASAAAVR